MSKTLKETFEERKLAKLTERLQKIDLKLLNEQLLLEKIDAGDLKTATSVIKKLRIIKSKLPNSALSKGVDDAIAGVNKFTGGGILAKGWNKLKSVARIDNPLLKALALASALENGLKQLPSILENSIENIQEKSDIPLDDILADNPNALKILKTNLVKLFTPEGVLGTLFKKVPFIDTKSFIDELVASTPGQLNDAFKVAQTGPSSAETEAVAKDIAVAITPETNKGTTPEEKSTNVDKKTGPTSPEEKTKVKLLRDKLKAVEIGSKDPKVLVPIYIDMIRAGLDPAKMK